MVCKNKQVNLGSVFQVYLFIPDILVFSSAMTLGGGRKKEGYGDKVYNCPFSKDSTRELFLRTALIISATFPYKVLSYPLLRHSLRSEAFS